MPADEKPIAPAAVQANTGSTELVSFGSGANIAAARSVSDQDDLQDSTQHSVARPPAVAIERADGQSASAQPVAVKSAKTSKRPLLRPMTAARPSSKPKQPKFVKSLMRSVKSTLASFGIN